MLRAGPKALAAGSRLYTKNVRCTCDPRLSCPRLEIKSETPIIRKFSSPFLNMLTSRRMLKLVRSLPRSVLLIQRLLAMVPLGILLHRRLRRARRLRPGILALWGIFLEHVRRRERERRHQLPSPGREQLPGCAPPAGAQGSKSTFVLIITVIIIVIIIIIIIIIIMSILVYTFFCPFKSAK